VQVKTKNLMVIGLAVLLVLLMWYRFAYSPMQSQASKASTATKDAEARAKTLRTQLDGTAPKKKTAASELSSAELQAAIPADPQLASLLRSVDEVKAASGISWQSITTATPTVVGGLAAMNVGITAQGSYQQVHSYVARLLGLKRLMVIDMVSFTAGGGTSGSTSTASGPPVGTVFAGTGAPPVLQAQISARVFSQPTAPAIAANGIATPTATGSAPAAASTPPAGVQNG
jgi:Tfp pilus assembly protein PilO